MAILADLVVGCIPDQEPLKRLIETFSINMNEFEAPLIAALGEKNFPQQMLLYGPYSCRVLLETALTTLIARVDPLRILFLQGHQSSDSYDPSKRNKSAIQWTGDILTKGAPVSADKLWEFDIGANPAWRALLGDWQQKLLIEPSFENLNDIEIEGASEWLNNLKRIETHGIGNHFRKTADGLYSELSKAVHAEYVIPRSDMLDEDSIRSYIKRTFQIVSEIALLSHFSPVFHGCLDRSAALSLFKQVEDSVNG